MSEPDASPESVVRSTGSAFRYVLGGGFFGLGIFALVAIAEYRAEPQREVVRVVVRDLGGDRLLVVVVDDGIPAVVAGERDRPPVIERIREPNTRVVEGQSEEQIRAQPVPVVVHDHAFRPDGREEQACLHEEPTTDLNAIPDVRLLHELPQRGARRVGAEGADERSLGEVIGRAGVTDLQGHIADDVLVVPRDAERDVLDRERVVSVVEAAKVRDPVRGLVEVERVIGLRIPKQRVGRGGLAQRRRLVVEGGLGALIERVHRRFRVHRARRIDLTGGLVGRHGFDGARRVHRSRFLGLLLRIRRRRGRRASDGTHGCNDSSDAIHGRTLPGRTLSAQRAVHAGHAPSSRERRPRAPSRDEYPMPSQGVVKSRRSDVKIVSRSGPRGVSPRAAPARGLSAPRRSRPPAHSSARSTHCGK